MPFCSACGHQNNDTARFCNACGQQIPPATTAPQPGSYRQQPTQQPAQPPPPSTPPRLPPPSGPMPQPNIRFRRFARTFLLVALVIAGVVALLVVVATCLAGVPDSPEAAVAESTKEAVKAAEEATKQTEKAAEEATKQAEKASEESTKEAEKALEESTKEAEKAVEEAEKVLDEKRKSVDDLPNCKDGREIVYTVEWKNRGNSNRYLSKIENYYTVDVEVTETMGRITCGGEAWRKNGAYIGWVEYWIQKNKRDQKGLWYAGYGVGKPQSRLSTPIPTISPPSVPTPTLVPVSTAMPVRPTPTPTPERLPLSQWNPPTAEQLATEQAENRKMTDERGVFPTHPPKPREPGYRRRINKPPTKRFGDGYWGVGTDIFPGRYRVGGPPVGRVNSYPCTFARLRTVDGKIDDPNQIIEIKDFWHEDKGTIVAILPSDGAVYSSNCVEWISGDLLKPHEQATIEAFTLVPVAFDGLLGNYGVGDRYENGIKYPDYTKVIAPGWYRTEGPADSSWGPCKFYHLRDPHGSITYEWNVLEAVEFHGGPMDVYIGQFHDGEFQGGFYTDNCQEWTPIE